MMVSSLAAAASVAVPTALFPWLDPVAIIQTAGP